MTDPRRYYGSTYCCPAGGASFTLIRKEITGCGPDPDRSTLRCPVCPADTAVRVSDEELLLLTGYVQLRGKARELIWQRKTESHTKRT